MSRTFRRKNFEYTLGTSWDRRYRKHFGFYGESTLTYVNGHHFYGCRQMTPEEVWHANRAYHGDGSRHWSCTRTTTYTRRLLSKRMRLTEKKEMRKVRVDIDYVPDINSRRSDSCNYFYC